ncbi:MAG TPA: Ig-like domain-containing protein [Opitutaceae bacterium]|jgi:hypothetical protein|nr:Ig-like domain-containing protein [Opitutaceae bacterium]
MNVLTSPPPAPAAPVSAPAPSASDPRPPGQRDLKSPYFLLRTPDGLGSYFTEENLPIVASPKEPLARFLAPARLVENGTLRALRYDISPEILETARPMDYLPQSEIDAFAAAVRAFYAKAHADTPRIVAHEKRLRAHFRLPNPELERDAYWVYGPSHDRRLLVLWGAEYKNNSSLPLAPDPELRIYPGNTLLDKLQARVMSWEVRQREALRFALDPAEPLSRFLARRAVNAAGEPVGVSCQGRTILGRSLRPLRRVYKHECAAFERAARGFYDRAGAPGCTAYEKEIRQAFRLPDPDRSPDGYFVAGKRLVIVVDGRESRDRTLPLTDHPLVPPAPVAPMAATGAGEGPVVVDTPSAPMSAPTVSARLRARAISSWTMPAAAAAAVLIAAAGALAWMKLKPDHTPPRVVESAEYPVALGNREVVVKFSKAIRPGSIQLKAGNHPSFVFGDDAARIVGAEVDPKDPSRVVLATSPLIDGKTYRLTVDNVQSKAGTPLADPTSVEFRYLDTVAPVLKTVSAGENANQLILVFSKPVAEASIARGSAYTVFALEAGGEGGAQRIASGHLDPEDKTGCVVILEAVRDFVTNAPYRLESLAGVTDSSVSRNPVALPPQGLDFPYRDVLPPRIRGISASAAKLELTVTFSKPVDPASARDLRNYAATGPDKSALSFLPGSVALDATGRNVTLRLAPSALSLGIYQLRVRDAADTLGNRAPGALSTPFEFADADRSPLQVASHSIVAADNQVDNKVTLTFNRALNPSAFATRNFSLFGRDGSPMDLAVTEARRVPDDPASVLLFLSRAPTPGVKITVHMDGVTDIFGQAPQGSLAYAFVPPGIPEPTEQVLDWISPPQLRGDTLTLDIKEAVTRKSLLAADDYVFSSPAVHVRALSSFAVRTDAAGARSTAVVLTVDAPEAARKDLRLRVRNLRAEGLEFLGAQRLRPVAVALQ